MNAILKLLASLIRKHGQYLEIRGHTDLDELRFYLKQTPKTPEGLADKKHMLKRALRTLNGDHLRVTTAMSDLATLYAAAEKELNSIS